MIRDPKMPTLDKMAKKSKEKDAFDEMKERDDLLTEKFSALNIAMVYFEDELNGMDDEETRDGIVADLHQKLDSLLKKIIKGSENKTYHSLSDKTAALAIEMQTYIFTFDSMQEDEAKNATQEITGKVDELLRIVGEK